MKLFAAVLMIFALVGLAQAAPTLVCDPQIGVMSYTITGAPLAGSYPALADGSLSLDLASVPVGGPYALQVQACQDPWGCSVATPFPLTRPSPLAAPVKLRLSK